MTDVSKFVRGVTAWKHRSKGEDFERYDKGRCFAGMEVLGCRWCLAMTDSALDNRCDKEAFIYYNFFIIAQSYAQIITT
jgi:hypothetical protein